MITQAIQNLFEFIGFLHDKKGYLLGKQPLIDKLLELLNERNSLSPNDNYKDRIKHTKIQGEIEQQFDIVTNETTNLIKEKIKELDIADISTPSINLNARADLFELKKSFDENDLPIIFSAKNKYLDFRTATKFHYFLVFFFSDLDRDLIDFFYFFSDSEGNEYEAFETKSIQVNDIGEAVKLFQQGHKKFTLPNIFLTPSTFKQQSNIEQLPPKPVFEPEKSTIEIPTAFDTKPVFNTEKVAEIFDILKVFFNPEHQKKLESILSTGDNLSEPLLFLENGNRLADAFKQLYNADFITGCQKKELEKWIAQNFNYRYRNEVKAFKIRYLNDIISTNNDNCKKPILNVVKSNGVYIISKV